MLFKKTKSLPSNTEKGQDTGENPYLNARNIWNAHESSIVASRQMWQVIGILCLLIALSAVGGIVYIGQQSKFIPYVVEVDKLGQPLAVGPAVKAAPVDERIMRATVASFIADARLVTPDISIQRDAVFRIYAYLSTSDPATQKMNEWLNGSELSNPFKRAGKETVNTEIVSVIRQSESTWQVDWKELVRDRQGILKTSFRMRALVTVYVVPPSSQTGEEQIRRNPLGVFIRDFNWSKQL